MMRTTNLTGLTAVTLAALVCLMTGASAWAVNVTWNAGISGTWNDGANWSTGAVPGSTDDAFIDGGNSAASTVSMDTSPTVNTLSISSGDTLQHSAYAFYTLTPTNGLNNAGTIRLNHSSGRLYFNLQKDKTNTNSGTIEVQAGQLWLGYASGPNTLNNTGSTIRALNGGILVCRNYSKTTITGGTFDIQAGGKVDYVSHQNGFDLSNVTATNAGTYDLVSEANVGARRTLWLSNGTTFANSGTLDIKNESTSTTDNFAAYTEVDGDSTITNSGVINIAQNSTSGGTGHDAYLQLDASTTYPTFTNSGTLNVSSVAGSLGTAQLSASRNVTNSGTMTIDGSAAFLKMAGQTFTQTAGTLIVRNGGTITADTVDIQGGTVSGDGTIAGSFQVGSSTLSPGNSAGTLSVTGDLALAADSILDFELDAPAGTNDLIAITGDLTLDGTLNITDLGNFGLGTYTLVTYAGSLLADNGLLTGTAPLGEPKAYIYTISTATANQVDLIVTEVPEPASLALLAVGGLLALRRRAR